MPPVDLTPPPGPFYAFPAWTVCITQDDMPAVQNAFEIWWRGARGYAPHLSERVRVAQAVVSRPEHVVFFVAIVADAYRNHLETAPADAC
jgi:hypothetical protein